jgi:hypothetical protein
MSNEIKLEVLEDLLALDTANNKAADNKAILLRLKQLIKGERKLEATAEDRAKEYPYKGVSVVGSKLVEIAFDLESKEARVISAIEDSRDIRGRNFMAQAKAESLISGFVNKQKEIINE